MRLTSKVRAALDEQCGMPRTAPLYGTIETGALENQFVTINLVSWQSIRCDQVRVPTDSIVAIREHPRPSVFGPG